MVQNSTGSGASEAPIVPRLDGVLLTIRADAGPRIGTGHVMRCLALAQGWRRAGGTARLVSRDLPDGLRQRAETAGVTVVDVPDAADVAWADDADLAVVDGWGFDDDFLACIARRVPRLLVVDDNAVRRWIPGDFILNQNIHAEAERYAGITDATLLIGPRYALLRSEFRRPLPARATPTVAHRLLLLLGGADPGGASALALTATRRAREAEPGITDLRLVVGPANPALAQLRAETAGLTGFKVLHDVQDMVTLMDDADLVVSASGSTVLELACRGVPMLLGALTPEEAVLSYRVETLGAARAVGAFADIDADRLAAAILDLARSPEVRSAMSDRARQLVDAHGVDRVIAAAAPAVLARRRPRPGGVV